VSPSSQFWRQEDLNRENYRALNFQVIIISVPIIKGNRHLVVCRYCTKLSVVNSPQNHRTNPSNLYICFTDQTCTWKYFQVTQIAASSVLLYMETIKFIIEYVSKSFIALKIP
jgi:hypothetical protein